MSHTHTIDAATSFSSLLSAAGCSVDAITACYSRHASYTYTQQMISSATIYTGSSASEHYARHALYFDTTRKPLRSKRAASKLARDRIIVLGAYNLI
jgi:hypothetical protein